MAAVNKVILIGHLGGDPESKNLEGGDTVVNFSLATSESWKNKKGEKVEDTQWHRIVAWRGLAEVIKKYCKKGDRIYIEGKLVHRSYDKDGEKKYITEIVVKEMVMLGNKKGGDTDSVPAATSAPATPPAVEGDEGDGLPF